MTAEEILHVKNVSVTYGAHKILKNVSLTISKGEMFGLIGLNGAGKTTLIKTILDLRSVNDGSINIFDKRPGEKNARKHVAFLPERFDPPWFLTGMEFLAFSSQIYGRKFNRKAALTMAEMLALDVQALDRRVQTYSKGMRQKLGLIGTILPGCDLIMLDEPMSGLDPFARRLVKNMILAQKSLGKTIFISSHILADMDEICDRIAVMHDGVLKFIGIPTDFKGLAGTSDMEDAFLHFIEKKKAA